MIEKTLHAGNIAAAFAVVATATDLTLFGGVGTAIGGALSATSIWGGLDRGGKTAAKRIAKEMDTALAIEHLSGEDRKLLRQLLGMFPPSEADLLAGNMTAAQVADILKERLKESGVDSERKSDTMCDRFVRVVTASLAPILEDALGEIHQLGQMVRKLLVQLDSSAQKDALSDAGITENAIKRMAERVGTETDDVGKAWDALQDTFRLAIKMQAEAPTHGNDEAFVEAVLRRVAELSAQGEFETANLSIDDALAQEEADSYRRKKRLLEKGLEVAQVDRDAKRAADRAFALLQLVASGEDVFQALRKLQDEWYIKGRDAGLAFEAEVAICLAETSFALARNADQRGTALNDLANALQTLGERESDTARLDEAVTAYRTALQEYTRERAPLEMAATQNNLGTALITLGARESGTARLEEAVIAYRAALQERTRERVPLDWAMTQNNLGTALQTLGARESGTARLEEAVTAYRAALQEYTRERVPLNWATTQNNLGAALSTLGERESDTARLEEAVIAFRAALQERTRERVPLEWAGTQFNLSLVLSVLADRLQTAAVKQEALACTKGALDVYQDAGAAYYVEKAERLVGQIMQELSEFGRSGDTSGT